MKARPLPARPPAPAPLALPTPRRRTTFRLWTPLAEAVSVNLYPHGNGGGRPEVHPMERDAQGVWSITLPGDQNGRYYTYTVQIDGKTQETGDPYAVAAGVNGLRSMILDLDAAAPTGWQGESTVCTGEFSLPSRSAVIFGLL